MANKLRVNGGMTLRTAIWRRVDAEVLGLPVESLCLKVNAHRFLMWGITWPSPAGMERSGIPVRVHGIVSLFEFFRKECIDFLIGKGHVLKLL